MADYTYEEAAALLPRRVGVNWLKTNIDRLPHLQFGRHVYFTDEHLAEIRAMHEHRPDRAAS